MKRRRKDIPRTACICANADPDANRVCRVCGKAMATYRVIQSSGEDWNKQRVIDSGLTWEQARDKAKELQEAEHKAHPEKTSWTIDLFEVEREN